MQRWQQFFSRSDLFQVRMSCVESLLSDLEAIMEDQASSDLTICCKDKEIRFQKISTVCQLFPEETFAFRVHKLILMARSPVFQAMLGSDMVEKSQGMIKIEVSWKNGILDQKR